MLFTSCSARLSSVAMANNRRGCSDSVTTARIREKLLATVRKFTATIDRQKPFVVFLTADFVDISTTIGKFVHAITSQISHGAGGNAGDPAREENPGRR